MAQLQNPLTPAALDEYVREVYETIIAGSPADAAAIATAIEAFDESAAVQQQRYKQLMDVVMNVRGVNLEHGQVLSLAITTPGSGYVAGDAIAVTTATGVGASARVKTVDGSGAILTVELLVAGEGYDVADTATTITSTAGTGGVVEATIAPNHKQMLVDARAILIP